MRSTNAQYGLRGAIGVLVVAALAMVMLAVAPVAPASSAAPAITRAEVIERAEWWFQASNGNIPGIAPYGRNPAATAWEPDGVNRYRADCSGMIQMAWRIPPDRYTDSRNLANADVSVPIGFGDLQAGDILTTDGHVTMFHHWVDQAAGRYVAYDFGGGGPGGRMEHREYTLAIYGDVAYRVGDDRPYRAYRALNLTG